MTQAKEVLHPYFGTDFYFLKTMTDYKVFVRRVEDSIIVHYKDGGSSQMPVTDFARRGLHLKNNRDYEHECFTYKNDTLISTHRYFVDAVKVLTEHFMEDKTYAPFKDILENTNTVEYTIVSSEWGVMYGATSYFDTVGTFSKSEAIFYSPKREAARLAELKKEVVKLPALSSPVPKVAMIGRKHVKDIDGV